MVPCDQHDDSAAAERVYRPLLFQSTGYASSELFHDAYEMHSRLPTVSSSSAPLLGAGATATDSGKNQIQRHVCEPQIRLETLSSRAATVVIWITYVVFLLAMVLPYLQSKGYLESVIELPGAICHTQEKNSVPCIDVNKADNLAVWSAYVANVSRYTGSIQIKLQVREHVNSSRLGVLMPSLTYSDTFRDENRVESVWNDYQYSKRIDISIENETGRMVGVEEVEIDRSAGYVLSYDAKLYGIDDGMNPVGKDLVVEERNQTIWVACQTGGPCELAQLLEITRDVDQSFSNLLLSLSLLLLLCRKPVVHVGEVVIRAVLVLASILALPCWFISVLNFHGSSWRQVLGVQKWLLGVGIALVLWQNPVYAVSQLYSTVSSRTRFVSITCQSFAEALFYVFWLGLMDQHSGDYTIQRSSCVSKFIFGLALFAVDTCMTVLRMPKLFLRVEIMSAFDVRHEGFNVLLGVVRTGLVLAWLVWIMAAGLRSGRRLKTLPYMATRFKQLSYRFLVLETLLLFVFALTFTALQVLYLAQTWYFIGFDAFVQDATHTLSKMHTGHPSLGQFSFLSVYVYLVMFVHLPPPANGGMGLLTSTAFYVKEKPRVDSYGFLTPDHDLFCVETAEWLLEMAYQAYFDPPGCPSSSGYGELTLERHGFELITHLRSNFSDTHAVIAWSLEDHQRLVISFRGTTSKENWKSNLRADQKVLWIRSRGLRWRKSCLEKMKDAAAKIPLLNMTLPRVHRGFWIAYESIRDELKDVIRLILDENPGVSVYVTGHSMGGALAVLAAYDLAVNFSIKVNMYNFGGPRVGNPSFRQHYDSFVPMSFRVVMDGDIVPGWPKFFRRAPPPQLIEAQDDNAWHERVPAVDRQML
uniref:Fungal lipase-type domain-containing protein n=1 Tax=Hyaloperonospora arabidopsidis (strain Emoy2) TaxID=559515 RepID=M4BEG9_HYAAE